MSQSDRIEQLLTQLVAEVGAINQEVNHLRQEVKQIESQMVKQDDFIKALELLRNIHHITSALTHNQIETQEKVIALKRKESRA